MASGGIHSHLRWVDTGKCVSGSFVVLNKPLLPFAKAAAACAKAGKKLATIDAIFGGTSASRHARL